MPHPVDVHVGKRIRNGRWMVGQSQQQLADQVGVRFQQIQKYETGANRISASSLWHVATALNVPISFFFEGLRPATDDSDQPGDPTMSKEALDLVRYYESMPEAQRRRLFDLAAILGKAAV